MLEGIPWCARVCLETVAVLRMLCNIRGLSWMEAVLPRSVVFSFPLACSYIFSHPWSLNSGGLVKVSTSSAQSYCPMTRTFAHFITHSYLQDNNCELFLKLSFAICSLFSSFFFIVRMNQICILWYDIRILLIMSSKKMPPLAFLVQLRSRGGLTPVQSNWLRGWFMVSEFLHHLDVA